MPAAQSVLLTRHGESEHNLNTRLYMGRSPHSRLTERGRAQAHRLGDYLAARTPVGHIVASSLPRALETARIVAGRLGIATVHAEDAFWELSKGDWEGRMPRDAVPEEARRRMSEDPIAFQYPGGESFAAVERRVAPAFQHWLERLDGNLVLFVLHGDVICALLHHLLGFPGTAIHDFLVQPCSLTVLARDGAAWRLARFNEAVV